VAEFHTRLAPIRIDWCRVFTVYGPGQHGSMLLPYAFAAAVAGRSAQFTLGTQQRDFLFVDDVIDWIVGAIGFEPPERRGELVVHHVGSGRATPVKDVLALVAKEFPAATFELGALPRRPGEPDLQVAPPDAKPPWGWVAHTPIEEGVRRTADWYRTAAHSSGTGN
jgi:nucleoside-diphosphate-sugar epimerase